MCSPTCGVLSVPPQKQSLCPLTEKTGEQKIQEMKEVLENMCGQWRSKGISLAINMSSKV